MVNNAFITGAASGIGFATALALYQQGWSLGLADIDSQSLQNLTKDWDDSRVRYYSVDVRNALQVQQAITDFAEQHNQQLRLLFNCAGLLDIARFEDVSSERYQQVIDVNIMGVVHGCQAAFPYLKQTPRAQVINMSSASATYGIPLFATYSASKFAVSGLTEALELEWQPYGIHVGDIMPPFVRTPMLVSQTVSSPIIDKLGVKLEAKDIAHVVLKQIAKPKVHRTVTLEFGIGYRLSQIITRPVLRAVLRWLSR